MALSVLGIPTSSKSVVSIPPQISLQFTLSVLGLPQFFPYPQYIPPCDTSVEIAIFFFNNVTGLPLNVSQAQSLFINIESPNQSIASVPAEFATLANGADGGIMGSSPQGLFCDSGLYYVWGSVVIGGSSIQTAKGRIFVCED